MPLVRCRSALIFPDGYRIGVFSPEGRGLHVPPVEDRFGDDVCTGGWNAGYATAFTHAWWSDGEWCCVDASGSPLAWTDGAVLHTRSSADAVTMVRVEVEPGWVHRRVVALGAERRILVEEEDAIASVDPTYDAGMLSVDIAWLEALAGSLGAAIGCPVQTVIG